MTYRNTRINYRNFNSQPHEEADILCLFLSELYLYFNSQPHEEADDALNNNTQALTISTHSLTKRLTGLCNGGNSQFYFNSQPHEEADGVPKWTYHTRYNISTHSLTKRLTRRKLPGLLCRVISTHSLTKRLTHEAGTADRKTYISTHSLTKRLTALEGMLLLLLLFQLTASRRG